jgi:hypothetical protein
VPAVMPRFSFACVDVMVSLGCHAENRDNPEVVWGNAESLTDLLLAWGTGGPHSRGADLQEFDLRDTESFGRGQHVAANGWLWVAYSSCGGIHDK